MKMTKIRVTKKKRGNNQERGKCNRKAKHFIVFHKFSTQTPSTTMTLCMRQMMDNTEACTMSRGICRISRLMASFESDVVCELNVKTLDFRYLRRQKSLGVRSI